MPDHLNARPRDRLKAHCKAGRLFDAERLLDDAGTARLRKTRKWTPLFVAVDRGFHSLVEVLLRYDHAQWDLEKAYQAALRRRRPDLAGMILRCSSWSGPIDPVEALATGDLALVGALKGSGFDFTTEPTILMAAIRNAKGVLEAVDHLGISSKEVEDQLYSAMVTHAYLGHVPSVMRFLRSGFDPHRVVPHLDGDGRPDYEGSAVSVAMFSGKPGFFKALRPSPQKDNAADLVRIAVFLGEKKLLEILFEAGFELNCKSNGGSPALDVLLQGRALGFLSPGGRLDWKGDRALYPQTKARKLIDAVETFVRRGAKWVPNMAERGEQRYVRDTLLALGEDHVCKLFEMLDAAGGANREHLKALFTTPRMKQLARAVRKRLTWV